VNRNNCLFPRAWCTFKALQQVNRDQNERATGWNDRVNTQLTNQLHSCCGERHNICQDKGADIQLQWQTMHRYTKTKGTGVYVYLTQQWKTSSQWQIRTKWALVRQSRVRSVHDFWVFDLWHWRNWRGQGCEHPACQAKFTKMSRVTSCWYLVLIGCLVSPFLCVFRMIFWVCFAYFGL